MPLPRRFGHTTRAQKRIIVRSEDGSQARKSPLLGRLHVGDLAARCVVDGVEQMGAGQRSTEQALFGEPIMDVSDRFIYGPRTMSQFHSGFGAGYGWVETEGVERLAGVPQGIGRSAADLVGEGAPQTSKPHRDGEGGFAYAGDILDHGGKLRQ